MSSEHTIESTWPPVPRIVEIAPGNAGRFTPAACPKKHRADSAGRGLTRTAKQARKEPEARSERSDQMGRNWSWGGKKRSHTWFRPAKILAGRPFSCRPDPFQERDSLSEPGVFLREFHDPGDEGIFDVDVGRPGPSPIFLTARSIETGGAEFRFEAVADDEPDSPMPHVHRVDQGADQSLQAGRRAEDLDRVGWKPLPMYVQDRWVMPVV